MNGNTSRVDLSEGEVRKVSAFLECLDCGRAVTAHSVGRKEECAPVAACRENDSVCGVAFEFACHEVTHYDAACAAVDHDDVEHFATVIRLDGAFLNLTVE